MPESGGWRSLYKVRKADTDACATPGILEQPAIRLLYGVA